MTLRTASACSALVHLGLLAVRPPPGVLPPTQTLHPLEVTYAAAPPSRPSAGRPARQRLLPALTPRTQRLESQPAPAPDPVPARPSVRPAERPPAPAPLPAAPRRVVLPPSAEAAAVRVTPAPAGGPASAATALPAEEFAAIEHKERVREHLRSFLLHPSAPVQGVVRIRLFLGPQGALQQAAVLKTSDLRLEETALRDAQRAAPYPPFPRAMRKARAHYEFLIRYEPE